MPCASQLRGVQPHRFASPPPPHVEGAVQPQSSVAAQPSETTPHIPSVQVPGVQMPMPHLLGPPAPQVSPSGQVPQASATPPQPSGIDPHVAPASSQERGAQTQRRSLHVFGASQMPQARVPPQPSSTTPHSASASAQVSRSHVHLKAKPSEKHWWPLWHPPQNSTEPQPSSSCPHCAFICTQVTGAQAVVPQRFAPPPPQNAGA
jgi:hypothetical protein